jgi:hypothetical protein
MTKRVEEALRNPHVRCLSHPTGRIIGRRPENALDLERVFAVALEEGVAIEVNGLAPRLDLSGEHVRDAIRAGVRIVCSTDAHSVRGLEEHGARGAHGSPRLGHRGRRRQHRPALVDPPDLAHPTRGERRGEPTQAEPLLPAACQWSSAPIWRRAVTSSMQAQCSAMRPSAIRQMWICSNAIVRFVAGYLETARRAGP